MQVHFGSLVKSQDCRLLAVPVLVGIWVLSVGDSHEEGCPVSLQTLQSPAWSSGEGGMEPTYFLVLFFLGVCVFFVLFCFSNSSQYLCP